MSLSRCRSQETRTSGYELPCMHSLEKVCHSLVVDLKKRAPVRVCCHARARELPCMHSIKKAYHSLVLDLKKRAPVRVSCRTGTAHADHNMRVRVCACACACGYVCARANRAHINVSLLDQALDLRDVGCACAPVRTRMHARTVLKPTILVLLRKTGIFPKVFFPDRAPFLPAEP